MQTGTTIVYARYCDIIKRECRCNLKGCPYARRPIQISRRKG